MVVSIVMLEKYEATNGKKVKVGSNTSFRSVKDALSTKLDSRGREDSQSS